MADPIQVDPKHYKVEFENDRVRVLRISFGPHEKPVPHVHPPGIVVILTDCNFKFNLAQGKMRNIFGKAGQIIPFEEAFEHLPENLNPQPFEAVYVEIKD